MPKFSFNLENIEISKIKRNPDNPRGAFVRDNDENFQYLKRSIKEFGLLVPIVVRRSKEKDTYILLDGERRYWALKELGIKITPAHIINQEIDADTGKTLMFHVHTNRVQWNAYQQCKAIEPIYEELKEKHKGNEINIAKELILLTGTNKRTINSRLSFLRWPEEIKNKVYNEKPELYYSVVEIENQIIVPASKNFPEYFEKVEINDVRRSLFNKYYEGIVHAAIEARKISPIVKSTRENMKMHKDALNTLKKLVMDASYSFDAAKEDFVAEYPIIEEDPIKSINKILTQFNKLNKLLENFDLQLLEYTKKSYRQKFIVLVAELQSFITRIQEVLEID